MGSDDQPSTVYLQDGQADDVDASHPMSVGVSLLFILGISVALWTCIYVTVRVLLG